MQFLMITLLTRVKYSKIAKAASAVVGESMSFTPRYHQGRAYEPRKYFRHFPQQQALGIVRAFPRRK